MTYTINIRDTLTNTYTSDELLDAAHAGLLYCDDYCLSEFVERILESSVAKQEEMMYSEEEYDNAVEESRYSARSDVINKIIGYLENL